MGRIKSRSGGFIVSVELLSPAGSLKILKSAVNAGADACYLGGKKFSARANATNFDIDDIKTAVVYAHKFQSKVYVAINTLIYNDEILEVLEYIGDLYEIGVDAIIIQDFAIYQIVHEFLPDFEIHASTQMAVLNTDSASFLKKLGFSRVVLGRELSLDEIKDIRMNGRLSCEVFIHGALCIAFSGLCLMSSLIGDRSGNRGNCAQPCRQKYNLIDIKENKIVQKSLYFLSPKDLSLAKNLPSIINAGVDSLKIEGRMKQDEYVYYTTKIYRELIDNFTKPGFDERAKNSIVQMSKLFNRNGFTEAFFLKNPYNEMMSYKIPKKTGTNLGQILNDNGNKIQVKLDENLSIGDGIVFFDRDLQVVSSGFVRKINKDSQSVDYANAGDIIWLPITKKNINDEITSGSITYHKQLIEKIKSDALIIRTPKKQPLHLFFYAYLDEPVKLVGFIEKKKSFEVYSDYIVSPAKNRITGDDEIREKINQFGNTNLYLKELVINIDYNVFIPTSVIKQLRQEMVNLVSCRRSISKDEFLKRVYDDYLDIIPPSVNMRQVKNLVVRLNSLRNFDGFLGTSVKKIILNISFCNINNMTIESISEVYKIAKQNGITLAYTTNPNIRNSDMKIIKQRVFELKKQNALSDFYINNIGLLDFIKELQVERIYADYALNITNDLSIDFYIKNGIKGIVFSPELNIDKLKNISMIGNIETEMFIYAQVPSMYLAYDLLSSIEKERIANINRNKEYCLENIHKDRFFILKDDFETTILVNTQPYLLVKDLDFLRTIGIDNFLIDFSFNDVHIKESILLYQEYLSNNIKLEELTEKIKRYQNNKVILV